MRRLWYAILLGISSASFSSGQIGPIRTGFAVITPITAGPLALSISETFSELVGGQIVESSVPPSPLVTLTSLIIHVDVASGINAGIAILDPFDAAANVTLSLVDQRGVIISARTIVVGAQQQRSRFVTELFSDVPELSESFTGQLFISSNVPAAVLGVSFSGPFFTALPAQGQLNANNTFPGPVVPTSSTGLTPITGLSSILFPQLAAGGGWASRITIANTSTLPQSVRVDFFDSGDTPFGLPISFSAPNTIIQPGKIVTFSTSP